MKCGSGLSSITLTTMTIEVARIHMLSVGYIGDICYIRCSATSSVDPTCIFNVHMSESMLWELRNKHIDFTNNDERIVITDFIKLMTDIGVKIDDSWGRSHYEDITQA